VPESMSGAVHGSHNMDAMPGMNMNNMDHGS